MANVLVYAEIDDQGIHDVSLQCLTIAKQLAGDSGGQVHCVALGSGIKDTAAALSAVADTVHVADDQQLAEYLTAPYLQVLKSAVEQVSPDIVLFPATTSGDDLAPLLAAGTDAACIMGCDAIAGDALKRLEFDRKVMTTYKSNAAMTVATVKDGAAEPAVLEGGEGSVQDLPVSLDTSAITTTIVKRDVAKKTVNLKDAKIIVAGGAGVGNEENFALIRELADALGAEIGATRAVVDAGWLPADHQIGQTGVTVRPDVYIACGISGAVQHKVGMMEARKIIAINIDANAPIFKIAHYKLVGDLKTVIPELIKCLKD